MLRYIELTSQREMPKLINDNRMELYQQGLTDNAIAKKVGVSQSSISYWRRQKGLPSSQKLKKKSVRPGYPYLFKCTGKPMETVLNADQCEVMRDLFRLLITASDRNPGKVDVSRIIKFYHDEYGGETIANIQRNPRGPK